MFSREHRYSTGNIFMFHTILRRNLLEITYVLFFWGGIYSLFWHFWTFNFRNSFFSSSCFGQMACDHPSYLCFDAKLHSLFPESDNFSTSAFLFGIEPSHPLTLVWYLLNGPPCFLYYSPRMFLEVMIFHLNLPQTLLLPSWKPAQIFPFQNKIQNVLYVS